MNCVLYYLSNKCDAHSSVGAYEFDQHLCTNIPQQLFNVFSDERIFHDGLSGETERVTEEQAVHTERQKQANSLGIITEMLYCMV